MGRHHQTPEVSEPTVPCEVILPLLEDLRSRAEAASRDSSDLGGAIDLLRKAGVLSAVLPAPEGAGLGWVGRLARPLPRLSRRVGIADFSLARRFERHADDAIAFGTRARTRFAVGATALERECLALESRLSALIPCRSWPDLPSLFTKGEDDVLPFKQASV